MADPRPDLRARFAAALQRSWESRDATSAALVPLAWLYRATIATRRLLYRTGVLATSRLPVPVIVVGNLTVGGAGKTPAVIAIAALLARHGWTPGIISRGYGRRGQAVLEVGTATPAPEAGDEPLLLARRTGAPVFVGRDRVAAGHALLQAHPAVDILLSDDGLQHLALDRDVEVLVFDERGSGNGRLLPAGPLREAMPGRSGPGRIVLYNAAAATTPLSGFASRRTLAGVTALDTWWQGVAPSAAALAALRGKSVVAAAGLAQPGRFFAMLREQGLVVRELALPDHYDFVSLPWPTNAADVVITEKDAVKIAADRRIGTRVWVAALDFAPDPAFDAALQGLLAPFRALPPDPAHGNTIA